MMSCVYGSRSRFEDKALDVGIPLLRIGFEVKAVEHNSLAE